MLTPISDPVGECDIYAIAVSLGPAAGRPQGYAPTMLRSGLVGPSIVGAYPVVALRGRLTILHSCIPSVIRQQGRFLHEVPVGARFIAPTGWRGALMRTFTPLHPS